MNKSIEARIEKCPYCRRKPILKIYGNRYRVVCDNCETTTDDWAETEHDAIDMWNRSVEEETENC